MEDLTSIEYPVNKPSISKLPVNDSPINMTKKRAKKVVISDSESSSESSSETDEDQEYDDPDISFTVVFENSGSPKKSILVNERSQSSAAANVDSAKKNVSFSELPKKSSASSSDDSSDVDWSQTSSKKKKKKKTMKQVDYKKGNEKFRPLLDKEKKSPKKTKIDTRSM